VRYKQWQNLSKDRHLLVFVCDEDSSTEDQLLSCIEKLALLLDQSLPLFLDTSIDHSSIVCRSLTCDSIIKSSEESHSMFGRIPSDIPIWLVKIKGGSEALAYTGRSSLDGSLLFW
jgi:hypothetical protein